MACKYAPAGFSKAELDSLRAIGQTHQNKPNGNGRKGEAGPAPTLATISANTYAWGYNVVFPKAAMTALHSSKDAAKTFRELFSVVPAELESVVKVVEDHIKTELPAVQAADKGAGVVLAATWSAPDVLAPAATEFDNITSAMTDSSGNALVLSVQGNSPNPGTPLVIWNVKSSGNQDQQWQYVNGLYLLNAQGLVAEIAGSSTSDSAKIQTNTFTGELNQQWSICGDGFIRSLLNGNVFDVQGGSNKPGTNVISYHPKYPPYQPYTNQEWQTTAAPFLGCNGLVTVIKNATSNSLYVEGVPSSGTTLTYPTTEAQILLPGSVATYATNYYSDNEISFNIFDRNYSTTNSVASFNSHQHYCWFESGDVWADTFNWVDNYTLNSQPSDWYEGSYADSLPGVIVCSVEGGN